MKLTEPLRSSVLEVITLTYYGGGLAVQSNDARRLAAEVACAASLGLITTRVPEGFSRKWLATGRGLQLLHEDPP